MDRPIIITGGDGALASYARGCVVLGKTEADMKNAQVVAQLAALRPRAIVHCAAMTDQRACEENQDEAYLVNAVGAYHAALAARIADAHIIYVSTNAVFDGTGELPYAADDVPQPQHAYGRSKYAGELLVQGVMPHALIVRTSWLFGGGPERDKKFVGALVRQMKNGTQTKAVSDVRGTPTFGKDLMSTLLRAVEEGRSGTVHLINGGIASRYAMAEVIARTLGSPKPEAVPASAFGTPTPKNEALAGEEMRPWQEALEEYVRSEWAAAS